MIYLVNPSEKHLFDNAGDRLPYGLLCLSSFLKSKGFKTKVWDLNHQNINDMLYQANSKQDKTKYFCIGIATPVYDEALKIAKKIRTNYEEVVIIAGGNHVTDFPDQTETHLIFDHVIVGDGENALLRIVQGEKCDKILYSPPVKNLDFLPMPDYKGVDMKKYSLQIDGKPGSLLITSRGCKHNCCYCGSAVSLNKAKMKLYRERSPESVVEEMEVLYYKYGRKGFYFADDVFTANKKRVMKLCELINKEFGCDITWRATTRADLLDEELIVTMKKAGCNIISLGLESGNDDVLKKINKGMTVQQNKKVVETCHKHGVKVKGFFIIGLPGDDEQTVRQTINFAKSLQLEYVDFYPLTPYPNTQIWNNPEKYGIEIIKPDSNNWSNYLQVGKGGEVFINIKHPNFSAERIVELVMIARKECSVGGSTYK